MEPNLTEPQDPSSNPPGPADPDPVPQTNDGPPLYALTIERSDSPDMRGRSEDIAHFVLAELDREGKLRIRASEAIPPAIAALLVRFAEIVVVDQPLIANLAAEAKNKLVIPGPNGVPAHLAHLARLRHGKGRFPS